MTKIGITGGIGSGKSVVSELLTIMNIPVYISDTEAKRLTTTDPVIRRELIALLGENVYVNGEINKPLLAGYLFSDAEHAKVINSIIHPRVKEDFRQWAKKHSTHPVVAMESAILIEAGFTDEVDKLIMVYAPLEVRIQRTISRDSSNKEAVQQRINQQMNDEEKKKYADFIILNDGDTAVMPQVENILSLFS